MAVDVQAGITYSWEILGLVWLVGLAFSKRVVRSQPSGARMFHIAVTLLGFSLMFARYFHQGWLATRILPNAQWLGLTGLAITVAGCLFAIWARITLGGNWSGRATVKADHTLITTGPYALARHPIYTGLLVGSVGSALAVGEARCLLGFVLLLLGFAVKMSQEEKLMMETFPSEYPAYRQHVKALIPGVV